MSDGSRLYDLALTRVGQKYVNVLVPKNNPNWQGPWDCAEFASWLVFQIGRKLYGCTDNNGDPALTEAYTGAWQTDSASLGLRVGIDVAAHTRGAFLLRYPPAPGSMGHIVLSDGLGGTVEAMGKAFGVRKGKVAGRVWNTGVLIPGFSYDSAGTTPIKPKAMIVYSIGAPGMKKNVIKRIQSALKLAGFDPGEIDGEYGSLTIAAVASYQATKGLVVDGQVGPQTARRLRIDLE